MGAFDAWDDLLAQPAPDPLEVLRQAATYQRYLDAVMDEAVRAARGSGATWADIGAAIGVRRQAAWQRWHTVTPGSFPTARERLRRRLYRPPEV